MANNRLFFTVPVWLLFLGWFTSSFLPRQQSETICRGNIVTDTIPPEAICREFLSVNLDNDGLVAITATQFNEGSSDPGGGPIWLKIAAPDSNLTCQPYPQKFHNTLSFCCTDIGDTLRIKLRVFDIQPPDTAFGGEFGVGHYSDCETMVVVKDPIKPIFPAQPDITVNCDDYLTNNIPLPSAFDICCLDTIYYNDIYFTFDTMCNRGIVRRRYTARDCSGNTATAQQNINVQHIQDYAVKMPNDLILNGCSSFPNFGTPQLFGSACESIGTTYVDTMEMGGFGLNVCFRIRRTWRIVNWCQFDMGQPLIHIPNPQPEVTPTAPANLLGPTVSEFGTMPKATKAKLTPGAPDSTDFSIYWIPNTNGYSYTQYIYVYDETTPEAYINTPSTGCDQTLNSPVLWNSQFWWDPVLQTNNMPDAPILLSVIATDDCSNANIASYYELLLDLDRDGQLETRVDSRFPPAPGSVYFNNMNTQAYETRTFDNRVVSIIQRYKFGLQRQSIGDSLFVFARWNTEENPNQFTNIQLPYGRHKINWYLTDQCGHSTILSQDFNLSNDCAPPVLVCKDEYAVDIPADGSSVPLTPGELVLSANDNATLPSLLEYGIDFAPNSSFPPDEVLDISCEHIGFRTVQVWARDQTGNADYCDVSVTVDDPTSACATGVAAVRGAVFDWEGTRIPNVRLDLFRPPLPASIQHLTTPNGDFQFNDMSQFSTYSVSARRDSGALLNGVSTWDLVLISRHILNVAPFTSPLQIMAADVNGSNTVTNFDIVSARKAILGVVDSFPVGKPAWRFIPRNYVFADPLNPFANPAPQQIILPSVTGLLDSINFLGFKVGDVDLSADPYYFIHPDDRQTGLQLQIGLPDENGIPLYAIADKSLSGFQFALNSDQFVGFSPVWLKDEHVAVSAAALHVSWNGEFGAGRQLLGYLITPSESAANLTLSGPSAGLLAECYSESGDRLAIQLTTKSVTNNSTAHLVCKPNPFDSKIDLALTLPESEKLSIQVLDIHGRSVITKVIQGEKGMNRSSLYTQDIAPGVYWIKINSQTGVIQQKVIKT